MPKSIPTKDPFLSVVIAAYNEEKKIEKTVNTLNDFFISLNCTYEIVISNDGSTDQTKQILENLAKKFKNLHIIHNKKNQGKGAAIKKGVLEAYGVYILLTDTDLAYPLDQLLLFLEKAKIYDVVVGNRAHVQSQHILNYTLFQFLYIRHKVSRIFNVLARLFFNIKQLDTQCGFKLFKKNAAKKIFQQVNIKGFGYDVEVLVLAKKLKHSIIELPVKVHYLDNQSKIRIWKHAPKMFFDLIKIKYYQMTDKY